VRRIIVITALEIIVVILALLIIGVVVAQKSKTQGMGAGFGGGAEDLFGSRARGMDALLSKLTIILSVAFTIFTLVLGRLLNTY
jgi:preprotein translocase subunit SecG